MTFPHYFHFFGYRIHPHLLMELVAYTGGFQLYLRVRTRWPRAAVPVEQNLWLICGAIFGALFGSKLLAWVESAPEYWAHRFDPAAWMGGKTIVGGLLGGWIGVEIAKRVQGIRHSTGDTFVFPLILGMAVGRIGCFLTGLDDHTYGNPTRMPWGINFGDGVPRHPAQLYDIVILRQHTLFKPSDVIPVPCHPDCLAMAYALKLGDQVVPLTGMIDPQLLLHGEGSTIMYEQNAQIRGELFRLFSTAASPASSAMSLKQLLCCLPLVQAPEHVTYNNIFRIIIMQFLDAHNFDVRSVKKSCVHIVHPDGRIIPFDTFNMFYRDRKEERLKVVRGDGNLVPLTVSAGGKHG